MLYILAHGDQFHDATTTRVEHLLFSPLVFASLVTVGLGLLIAIARWRQVSTGAILLTAMGYLLATGVFGYRYVPIVGGLLIGIGITTALAFTIISLLASSGR